LFFVYTFNVVEGPPLAHATFTHEFCFIWKNIRFASKLIKRGSRVVQKLFNEAMQKL